MAKYAAKGTVFQSETATPGTYQDVAQVYGISGPSLAQDALDVSAHDSPSFYREFVSGFKDAGEVTISMRFDPADSTQNQDTDGLLEFYGTGEVHLYRIIFPDTATTQWDFSAIVTGYTTDAQFDGTLEAEVTFKLTGAPTFAST